MNANVIVSEKSEVHDYLAGLLFMYYFYSTRPFPLDYKISYSKLVAHYNETNKVEKQTLTITKKTIALDPFVAQLFALFERRLGEGSKFDVTYYHKDDAITLRCYRKDGGTLAFIYPNIGAAIVECGHKTEHDLTLFYRVVNNQIAKIASTPTKRELPPIRKVIPTPVEVVDSPAIKDEEPAEVPIPVVETKVEPEPVVVPEPTPKAPPVKVEPEKKTIVAYAKAEEPKVFPEDDRSYVLDDMMNGLLKGMNVRCFYDAARITERGDTWVVIIYPELTKIMYLVHLVEKGAAPAPGAYSSICAMVEEGTCFIGFGSPIEAMDSALKSFKKQFMASYV